MKKVWKKSKKRRILLLVFLLAVFQTNVFAKNKPEFTNKYEIKAGADGYFIAKDKNGKYGLLDKKGEEAISFDYDNMTFPEDTEGYQYVKVKQNNAWGILDYKGKEIVDVAYDAVSEYDNDNGIAAAYNGNETELFDLKGKKQDKKLSGEYSVVSDKVFLGENDIKNEKDSTLLNLRENNLLNEKKDDNGNITIEKKVLKMGEYYVVQKYLPDGQHSQVKKLEVDRYVEIYQKDNKEADVMPEEDWSSDGNTREQVSLNLIRVISNHSILLQLEKKGNSDENFYVIYNFDKDSFSEKYDKVGSFVSGKAFAITKGGDKELYIIDENGKRSDNKVSISDYDKKEDYLNEDNTGKDISFMKFKNKKCFKLYSLVKEKEKKGIWHSIEFLNHGYVLLSNEDDEYGIIDKTGKNIVAFGDFSQDELKKAYCASNSVTVVKENGGQREVYFYQNGEQKQQGFLSKYKFVIIGAVIAAVLIVVIVAALLLMRKKKKRQQEEEKRKKKQQRERGQEKVHQTSVHRRKENPIYGEKKSQKKKVVQKQRIEPEHISRPAALSGYLKGIKGTYAGSNISIKNGGYIRIGRSDTNNEVVIKSPKVSRTHCVVEYNPIRRKYRVFDYSSNGTWLADGRRLEREKETWLDEGTILIIGNDENVFELGKN